MALRQLCWPSSQTACNNVGGAHALRKEIFLCHYRSTQGSEPTALCTTQSKCQGSDHCKAELWQKLKVEIQRLMMSQTHPVPQHLQLHCRKERRVMAEVMKSLTVITLRSWKRNSLENVRIQPWRWFVHSKGELCTEIEPYCKVCCNWSVILPSQQAMPLRKRRNRHGFFVIS